MNKLFPVLVLALLAALAYKMALPALAGKNSKQQVCYLSQTASIPCTQASAGSTTYLDIGGNKLTCTNPGYPAAKGCLYANNEVYPIEPSPAPEI